MGDSWNSAVEEPPPSWNSAVEGPAPWLPELGPWSSALDVPSPWLPAGTVTLSSVFSSGMVLQRDAKTVIWGWTVAAGANVTISFNGKQYRTSSDLATSLWKVSLD